MKTFIFILSTFMIAFTASAQESVGIGTTSPNTKAILDLTSTTKGFLMPRMTYEDRIAISSPPPGLMVYQTNSIIIPASQSGVYFYHGNAWKRIARSDEITGGGGPGGWTIAGDDQYHNLAGNVGIGTTSPTSKLHIVGSILQEGSTFALNHSSGILQFRNSGVNKTYVQLSGQNLRMGTNSGNSAGGIIFRLDGTERMVIDSSGDVGIGTTSPDTRLHVYGGILKVERPGTALGVPLSPIVSFEISDENDKKGGFTFSRDGTILSKLLYVNRTAGPNLFRFGMSDPEALDLVITDAGRVGVNMNSVASSYEGQLHIRGASGVDEIALVKSVEGQSPTIQFHSTQFNGLPDAKEVFVQLSDGDDLRMGTNSGNTSGKIIMRMDGVDQAAMNPQGWFGIGTTIPYTRLHIEDGQDADPNPLTGNGYICVGEITSTNIAIDNNEIMARDNNGSSTLILQNDGGLVRMGTGPDASGAGLHVSNGIGASLLQHGHVVIGQTTSTNVVYDNNEIQARSAGGASPLYIQRNGGLLDIGGPVRIEADGYTGEILKLDGADPNIGFYQSGVYKSFIAQDGNNLWIQSNTGRMRIEAPQVAIGALTDDADDYKLAVAGRVICTELRVELTSQWPDYVFKPGYDLKPIKELEQFIEEHHHLPNIPKASELEDSGIDVGEMNRKLMEKVEELTLYVIHLQNQIDELKSATSQEGK